MSNVINAVRSCLGRRLTVDRRLRLFRLLKEVTFGGLRRKILVQYYVLRARRIRIGPADLPKGRVPLIVDLGANIGEFTTVAASFADEVHAFEPDPVIFETLKANVAHLDNVVLHQAAVAAEDGACRLYRSPEFETDHIQASIASSQFSGHAKVSGGSFIVAPQVGIETLLKRLNRPVDIMKIDIEGAEVPLLEKLLASPQAVSVRAIYVETHEHVLPELAERTEALRKRARQIPGLKASFDWR